MMRQRPAAAPSGAVAVHPGGSAQRSSSAQRSNSAQRSGSAQRRSSHACAAVAAAVVQANSRPPSRDAGTGVGYRGGTGVGGCGKDVPPTSPDAGYPPRVSSGRPSPAPLPGGQAPRNGITRSGSAGGARAAYGAQPSTAGSNSGGGAGGSRQAGSGDVTRSSVFAYLKVYGLNQYARAFIEAGLQDLDAIGRLSETEALEFLERLRVYPGHRLRLLRAIDCLRHAALGADRRDAAQMLEDDAALERLCVQNEELSKEKSETEADNKRLEEENARLLNEARQQHGKLQKARDRIAELEAVVQEQTEQVAFLAMQLQSIAGENPQRATELYRSYRDSFDDWGEAEKIQLPEATALPPEEGEGLSKPRAFTPDDFAKASLAAEQAQAAAAARAHRSPPGSAPAPSAREVTRALGRGGAGGYGDSVDMMAGSMVQPRSKMAKSLDSAQIRECLAGFDVDHIIRCLATALQNKMLLAVAKPRPHSKASHECLVACAIYLEPAFLEQLDRLAGAVKGIQGLAAAASQELRDTLGKPVHPLNAIAMRCVPNKWDIYGYLRDVMVNFRLEPEVSVVTLFYLDRFTDLCGVAMTPDNWQRLTITAMMLASKVWNDESFENAEFAQLCPLYTLDEINAFERTFLKSTGYTMFVKGSEYAKTYFLLRTLGAKDSADFALEPLNEARASRLSERCLEKQIEFRERYPDDAGTSAMNWTM